jgi:hypothetical protein
MKVYTITDDYGDPWETVARMDVASDRMKEMIADGHGDAMHIETHIFEMANPIAIIENLRLTYERQLKTLYGEAYYKVRATCDGLQEAQTRLIKAGY